MIPRPIVAKGNVHVILAFISALKHLATYLYLII